jgi:rubrerythrin
MSKKKNKYIICKTIGTNIEYFDYECYHDIEGEYTGVLTEHIVELTETEAKQFCSHSEKYQAVLILTKQEVSDQIQNIKQKAIERAKKAEEAAKKRAATRAKSKARAEARKEAREKAKYEALKSKYEEQA